MNCERPEIAFCERAKCERLFSVQVLQTAVDTGQFEWAGRPRQCRVILGGDIPWVRRLVGVTVAPQVGSFLNEGVWDSVGRHWVGQNVRRTLDRNREHFRQFCAGGRSLAVAGCSTSSVLHIPPEQLVNCLLNMMM